ncbi:hypothetical protein HUU51_05525 [Candidatus Gracilibacteria bacterium]|nr:hypothetical protein [Candidatus Gracilibacteria bacterium]
MAKEIDVEAFLKAGFTFEEIKDIVEAEKEFEETGITYSFEEVKQIARKELFSKKKINV